MQTATQSRTATIQSPGNTIRFRVRDVTGTHETSVEDVPRGTSASRLAQSLASRLGQASDVAYSLRSDQSGQWLDDDRPIEEQIGEEPDNSLTLVPKTHLG